MPGMIFISYRRDDDPGSSGRLFDQLKTEFGPAQLFMDVEGNIKPGDDFAHVLGEQVALCDVLLAVIGPRWLDARDSAGNRRLDTPNDFVRIELISALEQGKRVIPVLVNGASIPNADELDAPLKKLVRRHAVRLTHERFFDDCHGLIRQLRELLFEAEALRDENGALKDTPGGREVSALGVFRGGFWAHFVARHPSEAAYGAASRASSRWRTVPNANLVVVKYISKRGVGVFIRGGRGADAFEVADQLTPLQNQISHRLGADFNNERYMFHKWMPCDGEDRSNWDRMADWLKVQADRYDATLRAALK